MRFATPQYLLWLWGLIPLSLFIWWSYRRRLRRLNRFAEAVLLADLVPRLRVRRRLLKYGLLLAVLGVSIFAAARPQWGYEMREVKRQGLDILIAMDTSRSMLTQDIKPDRLSRAKLAVRDFLKELVGDRVGLIAFAGDAFLVCPLTVDYSGFLLSLDDLDIRTIPQGGTNIAKAIYEAMQEYDNTPSKYKVVILITDGENLEDDPMPMVEQAVKKGIRIFCVGVGTQEGELIRVKDIFGKDTYVKDEQDNIVKSRLNEDLLKTIALKTGGAYVRASGGNFGLDLIYKQEIAKLERRDIDSKLEKDYIERFQIPLAVALLLLLLETLIPLGTRDAADGGGKR